tara:strand:+ start:579 stop:1439 length:861 start_codon:yes stop_codon:yes gene_type:complete
MSQVENILDKKGISFVPKGKDLLVTCFNPEHDDSNPSMRIDRESGLYHCLTCGYKGNLLKDLKQPTNRLNEKSRKIKQKISDLISVKSVPYPDDMNTEITKDYRGISLETLKKFRAFRSETKFPERLVIPVLSHDGRLVCMVGRYTNTNVSPKYLMKPKDIKTPMFPEPQLCEFNTGTLILVEGLFDAINMHDKGAKNVVATLGTKQFNRDNVFDKLLPYTSFGVTKVIIMFDGDSAGKSAAETLSKLIKYNTDLVVKIYNLPKDKDPGDLTQEDVDIILPHLNSL